MTEGTGSRRFSARRALILGFGGLFVLVVGLAGAAVFASISGAVIATGRVTVETRNHVVEHIDGGTVNEILVRDGDTVKKNDVLIRFADAVPRSEEVILQAQYVELATHRNRLEAEFKSRADIIWDEALVALSVADGKVRAVLEGQERLFRAREAARASEVARLRQRIRQAREEISGLEARAVSLREQGKLIDRELAVHRGLFKKGMTRLDKLLSLERAAKDLDGRKGTTVATIARVEGTIAELEIQILQIDSRRIEKAEEQARAARARENEIRERLASVRARLVRMEVRAPVSGTVFGMAVFAPQEVVRPGEPILHIVPNNSKLVVMARIAPIHVDQVYPGQTAMLRFSAFPARTTPEFVGEIVRVSADAVHDADTGQSWYHVEITVGRPKESGTSAGPDNGSGSGNGTGDARNSIGDLALAPGMPVEVHIRTGERSLISYLFKPVTDFFRRSLRED